MKSCQILLSTLAAWTMLPGLQGAADLGSVLSLSVLPLDKLLHVRRSLTPDADFDEVADNPEDSDLPEALPLRGDVSKRPEDKTFGQSYFEDDWKEDPWKDDRWTEDSWKDDPWKEEVSWKDKVKTKLKDKFKEYLYKLKKHHHKKKKNKSQKIQKIFQISITLLAFLAFGGYLIALVVLATRNPNAQGDVTTMAPIVSQARIYRRDVHNSSDTDLYMALRRLAEGYSRYNDHCQFNH